MKTEILNANHPIAIKHAVDVLQNGGVVAFPTDTVYGLGVLAFNANMVESLYAAKGRNSTRAIAVLIGELTQLDLVVSSMNPAAHKLAQRFWPGPLTLVLPRNPVLPANLSPTTTIGVRMPDHPVALKLLQQSGPLAVTSANLSGKDNTVTAKEVLMQLEGRIHLVLDGGLTPGGIPSTVLDCTGPELVMLRIGPIDEEQIQTTLLN
jgi:L-threonylcarbamoyladenylate synthase